MGWVKLDDRRHTNQKLNAACAIDPLKGMAANGLDANGLTYCAANETDGFVADSNMVQLMPGATKGLRQTIADLLVDVGRWTRDNERGGWLIHDYLKCHPSHADLEAKREADRERKRMAAQAANRDTNGKFIPPGFHDDSERIPVGFQADSTAPIPSHPDPSHPIPESQNPSVYNLDSVAAETEPKPSQKTTDVSHSENEKLRELIVLLVSVCSASNRQTCQTEASYVIAICKPHAPLDVIEAAIMAIAPHHPTLPRFLFKQFQLQCQARGLPAPNLSLPAMLAS